jgi:hypothetical protein
MPHHRGHPPGRPPGQFTRRLALYLAGVAIGLILVGVLQSMRRAMVPPPAESPGPTESAR